MQAAPLCLIKPTDCSFGLESGAELLRPAPASLPRLQLTSSPAGGNWNVGRR